MNERQERAPLTALGALLRITSSFFLLNDRPSVTRGPRLSLGAEDLLGPGPVVVGHSGLVVDPLAPAAAVALDIAGAGGARLPVARRGWGNPWSKPARCGAAGAFVSAWAAASGNRRSQRPVDDVRTEYASAGENDGQAR